MSASNVIESPITWIVLGTCILGCIYAHRGVVNGIIAGTIAPIVIVPLWIASALVVTVAHGLAEDLLPNLIPLLESSPSRWAEIVLILTDPALLATLTTAALFIMYCVVSRKDSLRPAAFASEKCRFTAPNPFARPHMR